MGQERGGVIRPVRYAPPPGVTGEIELTSLARMRERGGSREFRTPQRLDFDMLIHLEAGRATHTVDFTDYPLAPGDLLWVHAGQVQQWGTIGDIDGPVVLFTQTAVDPGTRNRIGSLDVAVPNHWPAAALADGVALAALGALLATEAAPESLSDNGIRDAARVRLLAAVLLLLVASKPGTDSRATTPPPQVFVRFRDEVEAQFRVRHKVTDYAARLGYSTRTLNRLAREHTGTSAKQFIDERIVLEAKRLLAHGNDAIARIADHLGFDDPANFSKYFQHRTGSTPAAFRAGARVPR